jgi:stress response protein SCP2
METITLNLDALPDEVSSIGICGLTSRGTFMSVKGTWCRLRDNRHEICRYLPSTVDGSAYIHFLIYRNTDDGT